jgi:hypothetical protein
MHGAAVEITKSYNEIFVNLINSIKSREKDQKDANFSYKFYFT